MDQSTPEEYVSASEDSPAPATLELFTDSESTLHPPPRPQRSRSVSRRPARAPPTVIPSRTPTQPVLVSGRACEDSAENTAMDTELSMKATKRKSPEKQRTNKHKKK